MQMTIFVGDTYTINRTIFDVDNLKIELSRDGGRTYEFITSASINHITVEDQEVYDNLNYVWTVTGPTSKTCYFKISCIDEGFSDVIDISDSMFSIRERWLQQDKTTSFDISNFWGPAWNTKGKVL